MMSLSALQQGRSALSKGTRSPGASVSPRAAPPAAAGVLRAVGAFKGFDSTRKDALFVSQSVMKQLQWDKLPANAVGNSVFSRVGLTEAGLSERLRRQGAFDALEEEFKAKQTKKLVSKQAKQKLASVLKPEQRQRIGSSLRHLFLTDSWMQRSRCSSRDPRTTTSGPRSWQLRRASSALTAT